jgi:predicted outer membrane protein
MKCVSVCVVAAGAAVFWTGAARAGNETRATPHPAFFAAAAAVNIKPVTTEQREERRFLKDAAAASRFQSEASRLALSKSNDAGVRSFAATLINHHAAATTTLQHMLHVRGMAPPMLDNEQRKTLNRLGKLQGRKFDREFMEEVGLKHQQRDVEQYEAASIAVGDPALKAWIAHNLPTLRYHLATAERTTLPEPRVAKTPAPAKDAPAPIKVAPAPGGKLAAPQLARHTVAKLAPGKRLVHRPELATQFMGAGPAKLGMQQPGGTMQLGVTKPIAARPVGARPIGSSNR